MPSARDAVVGLLIALWTASASNAAAAAVPFGPGRRVLLDAHNCYPYGDRWADRIDRALSTGTPLAIEQDLVWYRDPDTGRGRSLVAHDEPGKPALGLTGREPTLREYFFERIRPLVERALRQGRRDNWPLVTLNLDFKTEEPEHLEAVWSLLSEYKAWLTTARRTERQSDVQPLVVGPVLVLTGESDAQRRVFYDRVAPGQSLLGFGAARPRARRGAAAASRQQAHQPLPDVAPGIRTNYHRWWNNPWSVVEQGGQANAGEWTGDDEHRLVSLVNAAHKAGLWIRFYTLNGHDPQDVSGGWTAGYNFGSEAAAELRWRAAIRAGVDFIAVDQYERFANVLGDMRHRLAQLTITGQVTHDDYHRLLEREFEVPRGSATVRVELWYSGREAGTVIDLGLQGPRGFRGWSGGGPQQIVVAGSTASFGYQPGPIEPGRWTVILGVPNIRPERRDDYTITVTVSSDDEQRRSIVRQGPGWFVGDLHTHSGHSDGKTVTQTGVKIPVPAHRVFDAAVRTGLDFVALTDHNTVSHWLDVDRLQPFYNGLLLLHGREITTYRGHFNAIGERSFHDFRPVGSDMSSALTGPEADGAFIAINHPTAPNDERCMGCGWLDIDSGTLSHVNGVELANGGALAGLPAGWPFWIDLLNRGFHVTAVGGSDEHTPDEAADRRMGTPATVVFAAELSEPAIVAGLKSGRVYIRTTGPEGPRLEFFATADGRRREMGDVVRPGTVTFTARVSPVPGALAWIKNGTVIDAQPQASTGTFTLTTDGESGDWFALIVKANDQVLAIGNPIYIAR